jgi:hypothetical protein
LPDVNLTPKVMILEISDDLVRSARMSCDHFF